MVLFPCVVSYFFPFYGSLACKVSAQEWKRILDISFFLIFRYTGVKKETIRNVFSYTIVRFYGTRSQILITRFN